jgi:hypothetical protein
MYPPFFVLTLKGIVRWGFRGFTLKVFESFFEAFLLRIAIQLYRVLMAPSVVSRITVKITRKKERSSSLLPLGFFRID